MINRLKEQKKYSFVMSYQMRINMSKYDAKEMRSQQEKGDSASGEDQIN
jgi:hypothetical protein